MKQWKTAVILLCAAACGMLTACLGQRTQEEIILETKAVPEKEADKETESQTEQPAGEAGGAAAGTETVSETETAVSGPRTLSEEELEAFTEYINTGDNRGNYGFLLSSYSAPSDINLAEVFYSGAGLEEGRESEEERADYLEATGDEEIYTDLIHLTTTQLDTFLLKKTGLSYSQMKNPLPWVYLPEWDTYYWQCGDTNYTTFTCIEGAVSGDGLYTLRFVPDYYVYGIGDCETKLKKNGTGYQFLSNRWIDNVEENHRILKDQTFETEFASWGAVTFASYAPSKMQDPTMDVVFRLLDSQGMIYQFPGIAPEEIRLDRKFLEVEAVSFPDYNQDGFQDVIAIVKYQMTDGPNAGTKYSEVRIYNGTAWQYFTLELPLSEEVNETLTAKTIDTVMGFLNAGGSR